MQVGIDKSGPVFGDGARDLGIAITGKIGKQHLRPRLPRSSYLIEVDAAGAPGSVAGTGELGANQRIDDAGFSDVRTSEEGDLRHARGRKVHQVARREHEARQDPHTDSL